MGRYVPPFYGKDLYYDKKIDKINHKIVKLQEKRKGYEDAKNELKNSQNKA